MKDRTLVGPTRTERTDRHATVDRLCGAVVVLAMTACVLSVALFAPVGSVADDASAQSGDSTAPANSTAVSPGVHLSSALDNERSRVEAQITAESTDRALTRADSDDEWDVAATARYRQIRETLTEIEGEFERLKAAWSETDMTSATYGWRLDSTEIRLDALQVSTRLLERTMPDDTTPRQITRADVRQVQGQIEALEARIENQDPTAGDDPRPDDQPDRDDNRVPGGEETPTDDASSPGDDPIPDDDADPYPDDPAPDDDDDVDSDEDPNRDGTRDPDDDTGVDQRCESALSDIDDALNSTDIVRDVCLRDPVGEYDDPIDDQDLFDQNDTDIDVDTDVDTGTAIDIDTDIDQTAFESDTDVDPYRQSESTADDPST
jgi:hypothetical protein